METDQNEAYTTYNIKDIGGVIIGKQLLPRGRTETI